MKFYSGSKTFLAGEYNVLFKGKCIVLVTEPYFTLSVNKGTSKLTGIPSDSPGFKFYNQHIDIFHNLSIEFSDPHKGSGGWGASSAQYALLYKLFLHITKQKFIVDNFLHEYRLLAATSSILPSGADCLSQYENHTIFFDSKKNYYEHINISFPNLDFFIVKTKTKIPTHLHLQTINNLYTVNLENFTNRIFQAIKTKNEDIFCKNIQDFFSELENLNLVIPATSNLVKEILKIQGVKAAKGCGALSADTILVVCNKQHKTEIHQEVFSIINNSSIASAS